MKPQRAAFTLVEVIVAVGIFGVVATALIGLLAALQGNAAEAAERADATGACNAAACYLAAAGVSVAISNAVNPGDDAGSGGRLYLSRDLSLIGRGSEVPVASRFFAVTVERVEAISDPTNGFAAVTLRVEWPAAVLDSSVPTNVSSLRSNYVIGP